MRRVYKYILPLLGLAAAVGIIILLHREIRHYDFASVKQSLRAIPPRKVALAAGLTALSYLLLVLYDALALRQLGRSPGMRRTAFASFTAYVLSYNIGLSVISGTAVRLRLYSAWNYTTREITWLCAFTSVTFWVGTLTAAGALLAASPGRLLPGAGLLALVAAYLAAFALRRTPLTIKGWNFPLPPVQTALMQIGLGTVDVLVAGLVAWVVMPAGWPLLSFLPVYLLGITLGLVSHVPGGLGIVESVLLYSRPEGMDGAAVLGSILAYRVVYYLMPLVVAVSLLAVHEIRRHRPHLERATLFTSRWISRLAPHLFATLAFLAGIVLLVSGATPAVQERLAWLRLFLPLPILEISHLFGSIVGLLLLLVARGLQRRLDGAYFLTLMLLAAGALFSLLKGADWEEATVLLAILVLLLPCRDFFHRRASLREVGINGGWAAAILVALGASTWLGFFAYRHVEYRHELWWHFAVRGDAPRFLRASVAVLVVALIVAFRHLLRPAPGRPAAAGAPELDRAAAVLRASGTGTGHLALVGDKALLFSESGRSYIMYGAEGRCWTALGDPVGAREEWEELLWTFRERCEHHGAWAAFYEVGAAELPLYLDLGLTLTKLGEEASVPLAGFDLGRPEFKGFRQTLRRAESEGVSFGWVPAEDVPGLLPELRQVSDSWLARRRLREKGFSLGYFDEAYLRRNPVVVARLGGAIVAFANVWETAGRQELSVDLMRFSQAAPPRIMEFLLVTLMLRGREAGYESFNLGMAPLSGLENRALAPWYRRVGAMVFRHGERFYHFQGLRAFKEKFHPTWSPRYLASPGGLARPSILAAIAKLIARGPSTQNHETAPPDSYRAAVRRRQGGRERAGTPSC